MTVSSEVLQDGYAGNVTTLRLLQMLCRFSNVDAARYCGVSPHTFRRWRSDRVPPFAAVRLLAIRPVIFRGRIGAAGRCTTACCFLQA